MKFFNQQKTLKQALILVLLGGLSSCATSPSHSPSVSQDSVASYCRTGQDQIIAKIPVPHEPKYFFKPVGTAQEIAFVGSDQPVLRAHTAQLGHDLTTHDQNFLFNLETRALTPIPGRLDPIGLFKTDLVSIPHENLDGSLSMEFYDLRDLRKNGIKAHPLLPADSTLSGRYQSMGVVKREGDVITLRMITDGHSGGEFRDYQVDFGSFPAKLKPLSSAQMICKNIRSQSSREWLDIKLPMISKDAQWFSGFDLKSQKMKVFKLDSEGRCFETVTPALDRGDVGKFDFSPDAAAVAFHYSDRSLETTPLQFGVPENDWQLRSAIFNFKKQTYQLLPFSGPGVNSYYPAFLPNGKVLVLERQDQEYFFVMMDPSRRRSACRCNSRAAAFRRGSGRRSTPDRP